MVNTELQLLDQAFNQMTDISILFKVVDDGFIFLKANHSAYHAGFKSERYGKFVEEALPPNYARPINKLLNRAYTSKKSIKFNKTLASTTGKLIGEIVLTPLLDATGNCTHILAVGRDITESKKREEELTEIKSFYEAFLSSTTDGIIVTNTDRTILRANNGFTAIFGWEEDEIKGLLFEDLNLVPKGYENEHEEITEELLLGNNQPSYRTFRKRKNGVLVPVNASYAPLKGADGKVIGLIGIYRDITKQIEAEQQLEEKKQRYQSLVENHPDAIFQFDLEGNYTDANHALEKVTGYRLEELLHQSFAPLIVEEKLDVTLENFNAVTQGETRRYVTEAIKKDGELVILDVTNVPIIVNGEITGVFGIARNITEQKKLEKELIETKETLESFVNNTLDAIDIVDFNGCILDINPAFELIYGYSRDEILGKNISTIIPENQLAEESLFQKVLRGIALHDVEVVRCRKDGSLIDVSLSLSPIRNDQGEITSIAAISRNISEKKEAERRLKESEEKYRLIAENMSDLISVLDLKAIILYASPSHLKLLGMDWEDSQPFPTKLLHEDDATLVSRKFFEVVETKMQGRIEYRIQNDNGDFIWLDSKMTPIFDESGTLQHVLCISRDISERKRYESELEEMAFYDYLTGAANRRLFMDRLEQTNAMSKRNKEYFSLMMLDFDRFKWVNDNLGHDVGDELLVQFVRRIKSCIRDIDTLARLGGDEFAILIPGLSSPKDVEEIAQRILETLQEPWQIFDHEFITTSSIGVCISSSYEDNKLLMKNADQALYKAKQSGRNNYQIFSHKIDYFKVKDSQEIFENDILLAIASNEFYLVYQPKFHLSTKKIVAIEALIRWEHPAKGLILPDNFISRAEEMGLIESITKWVFIEAGRQAKRWQTLYGRKIPVSINISPKHLEKGTIVEDVAEMVKETGVDPNLIILEITESAMIQNMDSTSKTLHEIKSMGVRIAIDDFGTGFSSLSYLMKLEVDILKLDKTFVQEITSKRNASVVDSIVSLAHNLNLHVVAEGIETEEQCHILNQYGCDIGQGYYFSKPLMGDQLEKVFLQSLK